MGRMIQLGPGSRSYWLQGSSASLQCCGPGIWPGPQAAYPFYELGPRRKRESGWKVYRQNKAEKESADISGQSGPKHYWPAPALEGSPFSVLKHSNTCAESFNSLLLSSELPPPWDRPSRAFGFHDSRT